MLFFLVFSLSSGRGVYEIQIMSESGLITLAQQL